MSTPDISVVIPAYNRGALIAETLRSLLAQTVPAQEIIVVDDGSTDDTAAVAAAFGPPVRVVRQANAGPGAARNTGWRAARGAFIHFFDSDDLAAPNKQEAQTAALVATDGDIAIGPWVQGRFSNGVFAAADQVLQQNGLPRHKDMIQALLCRWSFVLHSALFRRRILEQAGEFDSGLLLAEDQLMLLRCLLAGARVVHTPATIEFYRLGQADKITENAAWSRRRAADWGRFLLQARVDCLARGIEPLRWFGFRRRIWEARESLLKAGAPRRGDSEVAALEALLGREVRAVCYRWARRWEQLRSGIQQRLAGTRAASCFYPGPLRIDQREMLEQLGYSYSPPLRQPWISTSRS